MEAKQNLGDCAITLTAQAGVERAERQDVPLPELGRQRTKIGTRRAATQRAAEPTSAQSREACPLAGMIVESRRIGNGLRQPELMRDAIDLPDAMPAICGVAYIETPRCASVTIGSVSASRCCTGESEMACG